MFSSDLDFCIICDPSSYVNDDIIISQSISECHEYLPIDNQVYSIFLLWSRDWSMVNHCYALVFQFRKLPLKNLCFFSLDCLANATRFSSSALFAQSLAMRSMGRLMAYTCTFLLCQLLLFYLNAMCLFLVFTFVLICHSCCNEKK